MTSDQRGPDDDTLRAFATTYTDEFSRRRWKAMTAAAEAHGISRATANRWAATCRERGYLTDLPTTDPVGTHVAAAARSARRARGWSEAEMANRCGTTRDVIANIESIRDGDPTRRTSVTVDELYMLAEALRCAPADLLPARETSEPVVITISAGAARALAAALADSQP